MAEILISWEVGWVGGLSGGLEVLGAARGSSLAGVA